MSSFVQQYPRLVATIAAIGSIYDIVPQAFSVGDHRNKPGENMGSLAILSFAELHSLREDQVLAMFGEAAEEVLNDTEGTSHPNIRAFLKCGLGGVVFEGGGIQLLPLLKLVEEAWESRTELSPRNAPDKFVNAVTWTLGMLDSGDIRVADKIGGTWFTHQAVKKAVLLSFRLNGNEVMNASGTETRTSTLRFYDKVPTKFMYYGEDEFQAGGFRVVPGAVVRRGSFIGKNVVLMPSFVNIGASVGEGTMVDAWATVGSCAQIGKNCHLSGGVGIGGVLEPLQANPTIVEDNCFIGARSEIVEGVIVEEGSVIGMGCYIGQSTPICDRVTGRVTFGRIPAGSVVIAGSMPMLNSDGLQTVLQKYCVVIIKRVDAQTRSKTSLNDLLRD